MVIDLSKIIDAEFSQRKSGLYLPNGVVLDDEAAVQRGSYAAKVLGAAALVLYSLIPVAFAQTDATQDQPAAQAPVDNASVSPSDQTHAQDTTGNDPALNVHHFNHNIAQQLDDLLRGAQVETSEELKALYLNAALLKRFNAQRFGVRASSTNNEERGLQATLGALYVPQRDSKYNSALFSAALTLGEDGYRRAEFAAHVLREIAKLRKNSDSSYDTEHKWLLSVGPVMRLSTEATKSLYEQTFGLEAGMRLRADAGTDFGPGIDNSAFVLDILALYGNYSATNIAGDDLGGDLSGIRINAKYLVRLGDIIAGNKDIGKDPSTRKRNDAAANMLMELLYQSEVVEFEGNNLNGRNQDERDTYGVALILPTQTFTLRGELLYSPEVIGRADDLRVASSGIRKNDLRLGLHGTWKKDEKSGLYLNAGVEVGGEKNHPELEGYLGITKAF